MINLNKLVLLMFEEKGDRAMKIVVIGGNGHIGTYLTPNLVRAGHEVVNVSRGERKPYQNDRAWSEVEHVKVDRHAADQDGTFGSLIRSLKPDIVMDIICFKPESAIQLVEALEGDVQQLIHCGTIWVHGPSFQVPTKEEQARTPLGDYGRNKNAIEQYLLKKARLEQFPATIVHPGHIVGQVWAPLNPAGHFNPNVFSQLALGDELALPNFGLETVHHVHAADVAQMMEQSMIHWKQAIGESFHAVSPAAVTLRGYAEEVASWFGQKANLTYLPWEEWKRTVTDDEASATLDHIQRSPNCSIEKARRLLDYNPRYSSFEAVRESVEWLIEHNEINVDRRLH